MQNEQGTMKLPSQVALIARLLVAGYLLYIVVSLGDVWNRYTGAELVLYIAAMVLFTIFAVIMAFLSIRDLIRGRYIGGRLDDSIVDQEDVNE